MKFLKYKVEQERTSFTNYIPTENWNFVIVSHLVRKLTKEEIESGETPEESLVFQTGSMVKVFSKVLRERKVSKDGKIMTERFDNPQTEEPYLLSVRNKADIDSILEYLNQNVVNAETEESVIPFLEEVPSVQ